MSEKNNVAIATPIQKASARFPAWRLPNGTKNASDGELEKASYSCELWEIGFAGVVVTAVIVEFLIAGFHPPYDSFLEQWGSASANAFVALGIVGEVVFSGKDARIQTELRSRSNKQLAGAVEAASEANERAAKTDLARAELEKQLAPRMLNEEQWDLIQSLRGKFETINIAFETDAESWWFATELQKAFMFAGIVSAMFSRDPAVHSFSIMIFEPHGFDGSLPRTIGPLSEVFSARHQLPYGSAAVISGLPTDVLKHAGDDKEALAFLQRTPMVIIGGRFIVPPSHWPRPKPKTGGA